MKKQMFTIYCIVWKYWMKEKRYSGTIDKQKT